MPADINAAITAQAKAAGKSKSDYLQAFLSAAFGDLIGNFSRTSELVVLMDKELSAVTGLPLTDNWYDAGQTLTENREYCRLLDIEAAGLDLPVLQLFRRHLFWMVEEVQFRADVDAIRAARLLPALDWPGF